MKKTLRLLQAGFQSSSVKTPQFKEFVKVFKKEFKLELYTVGINDIKFSVGHFYISGFFTNTDGQVIYFSLPDVRGFGQWYNPTNCMNQLMYRKAKDYTDYTGGMNRYAEIRFDMITDMVRYFS